LLSKAIRYVVAACDMFMHVPCWKLPRLHRAIHTKPQAGAMEVAPGYASVLKAVTRQPE